MKKYWQALVVLILIIGCRSLKPIELPDETAMAPATAPHWNALEAGRIEDWFLLLNDGDTALEWRLRMIDSATQSLDLQTFLWKEDQTGLKFFSRILMAADRGVNVRILLDDSFTVGENDLIYDFAQHPNIEFRIYNPFQRRYDSMAMRQLMNLGEFSRVDHRMHNKVLVADNRVVLIGGRNLADEYFGRHEQGNFRDMETLAAGPIVEEVSRIFDGYWNCNWSFPAEQVLDRPAPGNDLDQLRQRLKVVKGENVIETQNELMGYWKEAAHSALPGKAQLIADVPAEINPKKADEQPNQLAKKLIAQIECAKEELIVVSAYLIPTTELEEAVERAEKRGVRVRILTNSLRSNNHISAHSAYRHHLSRLIHHGADLHEVHSRAKDRSNYMQSPVDDKNLGLHAKLLLVDDDYTFIGSANLDPRSLRLNTEIGLFIESPELNKQMRELIEIDFDKRNAWHLTENEKGHIFWESDDARLDAQPVDSSFQRLEDWFFSVLPIDGEM